MQLILLKTPIARSGFKQLPCTIEGKNAAGMTIMPAV
jgi:hypothetical protein